MAGLPVKTAFEAHLVTWPNLSACPFADLNKVAEPSAPPYIEIHYPLGIETKLGPGIPQVYRESGGARFILTIKSFDAAALDLALGWVEELRDLFRTKMFGGVETFEASPAVLDDRNRFGNKFKVPFVVRYKFDAIKG